MPTAKYIITQGQTQAPQDWAGSDLQTDNVHFSIFRLRGKQNLNSDAKKTQNHPGALTNKPTPGYSPPAPRLVINWKLPKEDSLILQFCSWPGGVSIHSRVLAHTASSSSLRLRGCDAPEREDRLGVQPLGPCFSDRGKQRQILSEPRRQPQRTMPIKLFESVKSSGTFSQHAGTFR